MTLGERIRKLRNERNLTQLELANLLFVTDRAISKWEQGKGNPDISLLPLLAESLNVSIDYLITGKEYVPNNDDQHNELISYFESMIGQKLNNEHSARLIIKYLEKYTLEKIKDAMDICYDSYISKKEKPLNNDDVKDAINKVGGILYNSERPVLDRTINKLINYLSKNSAYSSITLKKECEKSLRSLLEEDSSPENSLNLVNNIFSVCQDNNLDLKKATAFFNRYRRELNKKDSWQEIDVSNESPENDPYIAIGYGRLKLSIGACKLINNFDSFNYVSFTKAKLDRVFFIGLKLEKTKSKNSFLLFKMNDGEYGASVDAPNLIVNLYGEEGASEKYTKHDAVLDPKNPGILVIYTKHQKRYFVEDENGKKQIRRRHINTIIDKEWKVICSRKSAQNGKNYPTYLLRNINTGEEIEISTRALADIEKGNTSVESIKTCREIGTASYLGKKMAEKKKRLKKLDVKNYKIPKGQLDEIKQTDLFLALKDLRTKIAKDNNVESFVVAGDRLLARIAIEKPSTKAELLSVYGFGKRKYNLFGKEILTIVKNSIR